MLRPPFNVLVLLLLALPLAACNVMGLGGGVDPTTVSAVDVKPGDANPAAAAAMVSDYRRSRGLSAVTIDSRLAKIAADHARRMAALDRIDHVLPGEGSFMKRVTSGGYDAAVAAENIGAGYKTLVEAMNAWKKSPHHNENLLRTGITEIGIAVSYAPGSKFKYYWSLVLAGPYKRPEAGSTFGGPFFIGQ
jgi:uncharacterized protein YkwD